MNSALQPFAAKPKPGLYEVRYSYKEMMDELKAERAAAVYSMEKLDQAEIAKLFKARRLRRDKDRR